MPTKTNMKKNAKDHNGANGIRETAFGYTTNASPGPDAATCKKAIKQYLSEANNFR
jgi:hypothetical protein